MFLRFILIRVVKRYVGLIFFLSIDDKMIIDLL